MKVQSGVPEQVKGDAQKHLEQPVRPSLKARFGCPLISTGLAERYVREWAFAQAANDLVQIVAGRVLQRREVAVALKFLQPQRYDWNMLPIGQARSVRTQQLTYLI